MIRLTSLLLVLILLVGCSTQTSARPDDVREDIWHNGKIAYDLIDQFYSSKVLLDSSDELKIKNFTDQYGFTLQPIKEGYTEKEGDITGTIYLLYANYLKYKLALQQSDTSNINSLMIGIDNNLKVLAEIYK
jgi:hypothetical protein